MLFSRVYDISKSNTDDWFDPILSFDTLLFIDPLLLFETPHSDFIEGPSKIINFFNRAFELAAQSTGSDQDLRHRQLLMMLIFPEVKELCLGYATSNTEGSGSGTGYSKKTVAAIYESIQMGMKNISNFEFLGLFNEGIGRDRISDITGNILKREFIRYTQNVCKQHNIPMEQFPIRQVEFNMTTNRWNNDNVLLPRNPFFDNRAIILTPGSFIDEKPHINSDSFKDFVWERKDDQVRDEFNIQIKSEIDKLKIIAIAKKFRGWMDDFKNSLTNIFSYNTLTDPSGIYNTTIAGFDFASTNPFAINVSNRPTFETTVDSMVDQYANFIENNSGYYLLWNDDTGKPKKEKASQLVFTGILKSHCQANNIDISGEANLGRGPVDFKFSKGYRDRVAIEIKKSSHSRFWNGLTKQLPKYMESESIDFGYFIIICLVEEDFKRLKEIEKTITEVANKHNKVFKYKVIDATPNKPSASTL